jgi:hypothetical protein
MIERPNKLMAMSQSPSGRVLVTAPNLTREVGGDDPSVWQMCSDSVATEIVPMTEAAFADFISRHGGKPIYPTLAAYPAPRG